MLKKLLLAGAASTLLMGTAQAADYGEVFDWTGIYIGLQAGYAWNDLNVDVEAGGGADPLFDADAIDSDGFVGGFFTGVLFQRDSLVFGLEGDIEFADISGSSDLALGPLVAASLDSDIDWLGSVRLRAGYTMNRALIYLTGGLAAGGVNLDADIDPAAAGLVGESDNATEVGWTIGGGVEYAFTDDLSFRVEYRYTDLGTSEVRVASGMGAFLDNEVSNDFHAVRGGIAWRF